MPPPTAWARFAGRVATDVVECVDIARTPERLDAGLWFVVVDFEADLGGGTTGRPGRARAWRFATVGETPSDAHTPSYGRRAPWRGPAPDAWTTTLDEAAYQAAVERVRDGVRAGGVYQANICRVMAAPLPVPDADTEPDACALAQELAAGNPAPHAVAIHVPRGTRGPDGEGVDAVWVVSASPELYLARDGAVLESGPIKGTAPAPSGLSDKDRAENVMIVDLVRNDLHQVCRPDTVDVTHLLAVEQHPGLVHLVSRVRGELRNPDAPGAWRDILSATFPPASVSGAPKSSALRLISDLEPTARGPYCGAIGWIDGDARRAELAVGIRTFWWDDGTLRFGTGAGITWGSAPAAEWHETELKAARLVRLASNG